MHVSKALNLSVVVRFSGNCMQYSKFRLTLATTTAPYVKCVQFDLTLLSLGVAVLLVSSLLGTFDIQRTVHRDIFL
jgi:hypothetical protein